MMAAAKWKETTEDEDLINNNQYRLLTIGIISRYSSLINHF